ncbi:MAG: hypothetical protein LC104_13055 [Bacteroidales bacterium]|nr:hypothetical protein [Bacteroidales bacterium]
MSSTDPFDSDDGWADLARELELDRNSGSESVTHTQADPVEYATHCVDDDTDSEGESSDPDLFDAVSRDRSSLDDDDGDEDGELGSTSAEEEGEDGGTKKRRRRRRRRKKKAGATDAQTAEGHSPETHSEEGLAVEAETEEVEESYADDSDHEGTTPEMTRELIRTWNVPSWNEIVAGLYRPQDR